MNEIILELPYPPSVNHYYRYVRSKFGVTCFIDARGQSYRDQVAWIVIEHKRARNKSIDEFYFLSERLSVEMYVYPPDHRVRDLDNIFKGFFDSLQCGVVFKNDNQIDKIYAERKEVVKNGKILVHIKQIRLP